MQRVIRVPNSRSSLVWSGLILSDLVWHSLVWLGPVWSGVVWPYLAWRSLVCAGMVRSGLVWSALVWLGPVWSGLAWCGLLPSLRTRTSLRWRKVVSQLPITDPMTHSRRTWDSSIHPLSSQHTSLAAIVMSLSHLIHLGLSNMNRIPCQSSCSIPSRPIRSKCPTHRSLTNA